MKKLLPIFIMLLCVISCGDKKHVVPTEGELDEPVVVDTALYGKCGEATSMHSLQLLTDDGDELTLYDDPDSGSIVLGAMMPGDRMTVSYIETEDGLRIKRAVNLTTLLGRWTSIDRNFLIQEDGTVVSSMTSESNPYKVWSMANTNLILNNDTFAILSLGADSLELENSKGIFVYKRQ